MTEVSVIGGGWSVKSVDLDSIPGTIIAVNDSAFHAPYCDLIVSMDRLWTEYRWNDLRKRGAVSYLRRSAVQNLDTKFPWCHIFDCDHTKVEFSDYDRVLNGTSSGMCALNLAYILRPKTVYLFGFDMCRGPNGQAYWYPPYPWTRTGGTSNGKYADWAKQFARPAKLFENAGIEVLNVSPGSAITAFPKIAPQELLRAA